MLIRGSDILSTVNEYYFSTKLRQVAALERQGKEIINLGVGNPSDNPHTSVIETLKIWADRPVHGYQSYKGSDELLEAMELWYKRFFGIELKGDENFLPLFGSKEGINYVVHAFVNPGEEVLVPDPGYPAYRSVALLYGAKVKKYDLTEENDFYPDFDQLEELISPATKLIFVNYPNMPTGTKAHKQVFDRFVDIALRHKVLLVHDNPYSFLQDDQLSIFSVPRAMEVAIELNSLSKSHNMAGWRIGMAVGLREYIDNLLVIKSNANTGYFFPVQKAVIRALYLDKEWYDNLRKKYSQKRLLAEEKLSEMGFTVPVGQAGMFVWARVPSVFVSGVEASDYFLERSGVFITPGRVFGKNGDKYVRVSLSVDFPVLKLALERMFFSMNKLKNPG